MKLRRLANAMAGVGPWRLTPFNDLVDRFADDSGLGVHRAERHVGVLQEVNTPPAVYTPAHSLLGQAPLVEQLPEGPRYQIPGLVPRYRLRLMTLTDACSVGSEGVVYCPRRRSAVMETVRCWSTPALSHPLLGAVGLPPAQPLAGLTLSLASFEAEGFYHHLTESLPRLRLALPWLPAIDHVLVSGQRHALREAWFEAAGIPLHKLRWLGGLSHFRCEQLVFADCPMHDSRPSLWIRESLQTLFPASVAGPARRWLWLSRADATQRHLVWEDELLVHFPRFEKIVLSKLTPHEQVALFKGAAVVAGPHGAGLANLVFAPPGVQLVEFFPDDRYLPLYSRYAHLAEGRAAWAKLDFHHYGQLPGIVAALRNFLPA